MIVSSTPVPAELDGRAVEPFLGPRQRYRVTAIQIEGLRHQYPDRGKMVTAVDGVSFKVEENEFYTLLGPSGCGKTTTLRCLAGLERPSSGTIDLSGELVVSDGRFVPTHRRDIGMVFQDYAVWPHMTVFENVAFPLRVSKKRTSNAEIRNRVHEVLALLSMEDYVDRHATQLSGGQQQRLSLARALVREPKVLLLDQPLSNLDARLRDQMRTELRSIQRRLGLATVFVTHDQVEALSMSNRVAVMDKGKIVQEGRPREIYHSPNSEFVAAFVGTTNFLRGAATASVEDVELPTVATTVGDLACRTDERLHAGAQVTIAIRPEAIQLSTESTSTPNTFEGEIDQAIYMGEAVDYRVRVDDEVFKVKGDARSRYHRGDRVFLTIPPDECVVVSEPTTDEAAIAERVD